MLATLSPLNGSYMQWHLTFCPFRSCSHVQRLTFIPPSRSPTRNIRSHLLTLSFSFTLALLTASPESLSTVLTGRLGASSAVLIDGPADGAERDLGVVFGNLGMVLNGLDGSKDSRLSCLAFKA